MLVGFNLWTTDFHFIQPIRQIFNFRICYKVLGLLCSTIVLMNKCILFEMTMRIPYDSLAKTPPVRVKLVRMPWITHEILEAPG